MVDYFLLISGVEFLGASLIFDVRISNLFFMHNYITDPTNSDNSQLLGL